MNLSPSVRAGELQRTIGASRQIGRTQVALSKASQKLSTGKEVLRPSDAPGDAAASLQIRRNIEIDRGYDRNLAHADRMLSRTDESLGELTDLLREARQIGLANTGDQATQAEREGAAEVLRTLERQMLAIANATEGGIALFGGGSGSVQPFTNTGVGVRFDGGDTSLAARTDSVGGVDFLVHPSDVFGGNSVRIGTKDLNPPLTAATRLSELAGARGEGVERGSIRLTSGGASEVVDLSSADTLGDVLNLLNGNGLGVTATLTATGIDLSGAGVTVGEFGQATAADLGLLNASPAATVTGSDLDRRVTAHTSLSDIGIGADSFKLTNGQASVTLDTTGMTTVGELVNAVNGSGLGVDARISDDGSRVLLRNAMQGSSLQVVDVSGTVAEDLGWLTFTADSPLAELNGGQGVTLAASGPDLKLEDAGGVTFDVDLDGATTVQDAINLINTAAGGAGSTLVASFDPTAPGLSIANVTSIANHEGSTASADLGLETVSGTTIAGRDVNQVAVDGPFAHVRSLITAFERGDIGLASKALERLETAEQRVISVRGEVGGRVREVNDRRERLADHEVAQLELLGRLEDADYASAVLEYQTLQTSLQAQLQTTSRLLGQSLFDYLR